MSHQPDCNIAVAISIPVSANAPCAECRGTAFMIRTRGLCAKCYRDPSIRERHPPTSKYARRGIPDSVKPSSPMPALPTHAEPGSEEKVREMCRRAARRECLHHPEDPRIESARSVGILAHRLMLEFSRLPWDD